MSEEDADAAALRREIEHLRDEAALADRRARATHAIAQILAEERTESAALPRVLAALGGALDAALAGYWVPAGDELESRMTWRAADAPAAWEDAAHRGRLRRGADLAGRAWSESASVQVRDGVDTQPPRSPLLAEARIRAGLAFPVTAGREVLGVIDLYARAAAPADDRLAETLRTIGGLIGQFIRSARALALEHDTLLKLYDLGRSISGELDPQALAQVVAEAAIEVTGAQRAALFYRSGGDGSELEYAVAGFSREELAKLTTPRATPLLGPTFNGRFPIRIDDVTKDPRFGKNPPYHGLPDSHFPVRSYLAVPIPSRTGRFVGALFLGHDRPGAFDERSQRLAVGLASHAATAMDNATLFGEQQRLIEALEKTNTELDQFAYAASHDLRAPLRGIANLASWIEEDLGSATPKRVRDHVAMLKKRASRMDKLILGLLELARVGRARQAPERVDLTELIHETVDLLSPSPASRILIVGAMPTLIAERVALQQVFLNLIANALQHSGKPDVVVRITSIDRGDEVEISVADDGVGIAPELQAQCWEIFQTLQSRDIVESTGIGLAIVRKQTEASGGRAWFVPQPKHGVDVRFTWPKRTKERTK